VQNCYDYINQIWKTHGLYINHKVSVSPIKPKDNKTYLSRKTKSINP